MTQPARPWDITELAVGDARGLRVEYKTRPDVASADTDLQLAAYAAASAGGDLDSAGARLGVDVADLVRIRRAAGIAPPQRRRGILTRLFRDPR